MSTVPAAWALYALWKNVETPCGVLDYAVENIVRWYYLLGSNNVGPQYLVVNPLVRSP
jgi:hypothetical protein